MSDDHSKDEQDHWRRLADELGLPPHEAPARPAATPAARPEPPVVTAPPVLRDEVMARETAVESPVYMAPASPIETPEVAAELDVGEEAIASAPRRIDEESRREDDREGRGGRGRGRRRRGRGRGERRDDVEPAPEPESPLDVEPAALEEEETDSFGELEGDAEEAAAEEAAAGEHEGGRRKRRRRRRRRKSGDTEEGPTSTRDEAEDNEARRPEDTDELLEEADEEEDERQEPAVIANTEEDDEPEEDFSDWNVPSWNELIASLYRPDR